MVDFIKYWKLYLAISTLVILSGLASILIWQYTYSVEFVGGTNAVYRFKPVVNAQNVKKVLETQKVEIQSIEQKGDTISVRTKAMDEKKETAVREVIEKNLKTKITVLSVDTVGPTIGKETVEKTLLASGLAILGILLYIAYAFKNLNYALAAVLALIHDMLVVVGTYSLFSHFFGAELDTLFVTALLTTMSFSVHDTIVVFDQIRDYKKRLGQGDIKAYANRALNDTMVRSLNNSMTIIFMLVALVLLGGSTIRFFALTLLIGTITGTYSSPFVATPIAVWLESRKK